MGGGPSTLYILGKTRGKGYISILQAGKLWLGRKIGGGSNLNLNGRLSCASYYIRA